MKNYTVKLKTDRLILRRFKVDDYKVMFDNWCSNPTIAHNAGWPVHTNYDDTKGLVEYWVDEYKNDYVFNWIIELKNSEPIGSITVIKKDNINRVCEIGYNISQKYWNNGYATEAINEVIKYIFSLDLYDTIVAQCFEFNVASYRVLEKNKFKKDGLLRNRYILDGKATNLIELSLIREEFKQ